MPIKTVTSRLKSGWIIYAKQGKRRILQRLRRLEQGNYGDVAPIGDGLSKLRMFFGSGYRVYFGEDAENIGCLGLPMNDLPARAK